MSDWTVGPGTAPTAVPGDPGPGPEDTAAGPGPAPSHEPAPPTPLGVVRTATGNPAVDAALERLADADHLPADGHTEVYEDVHRGLRDTLTALDARPAPAPPYDNRS